MGQTAAGCCRRNTATEKPVEPPPPQPEEAPLVAKGAVVKKEEKGHGCCYKCCFCCCVLLAVLLLLLGIVALFMKFNTCAIKHFPVEQVLPSNAKAAGVSPPFEIANETNMQLGAGMDLDLTGAWWMDGNPLTYEQLVSFAGAKGSLPYPTTVEVPTSQMGRWSWSDNFLGRGIMAYYAFTSNPDEKQQFQFKNSTYADIIPVGDVFKVSDENAKFGFKYMNANEWDRVDTYVLRRIIYGNGTAHPQFWPKFVDWYKETWPDTDVIVRGTNNHCLRICANLAPCFLCTAICGDA